MTTNTRTGGEPVVIHGVPGLLERAGQELGVSDWVDVVQDDVTAFARLTGDEQWIHVDPDRARGEPFGTTVQHGFLTLALSTGLLDQVFRVEDVGMVLNQGLARVRFTAPLPVGARMRMLVSISAAAPKGDSARIVYHLVYEVEGQDRPCCVADLVFRYSPAG